jgi:hypothetical protein
MSLRDHDNSPSTDVNYPRSPEEFGAGAILTGVLAALLVIGVVVYSIVNMNEVQRATMNPLPLKPSLETTGQSTPVPTLPGTIPQAAPRTEIPPR